MNHFAVVWYRLWQVFPSMRKKSAEKWCSFYVNRLTAGRLHMLQYRQTFTAGNPAGFLNKKMGGMNNIYIKSFALEII
jgi:hypothetical protein